MLEQEPGLNAFAEYMYTHQSDVWLSANATGQQFSLLSVSPQFEQFTDIQPVLGRFLLPSDHQADATPAVVISNSVWQRLYAGSKEVIGKSISVGNRPSTIVGVMPEGFRFPTSSDLWQPFHVAQVSDADSVRLYFSARDNHHDAEVQQFIRDRLQAAGYKAVPDSPVDVRSMGLVDANTDGMGMRTLIGCLFLVVAIVLVAAINISNLLLARAIKHQREAAVRAALGASKGRVMRLLACEGIVLCASGLLIAVILASLLLDGLNRYVSILMEGRLPYWWVWKLDIPTLLLMVSLTVLILLFAVLIPAYRTSNFNINQILRDGTRGAVSKTAVMTSKRMLGIQLGIVSFLVMVGGVMMYVLLNLILWVDLDKSAGNFSAYLSMKNSESISIESQRKLLSFLDTSSDEQISGSVIIEPRIKSDSDFVEFESPEVFSDLQIRRTLVSTVPSEALISGRNFSLQDDASSEPVAIINEYLALEVFGSLDVVGRQLVFSPSRDYFSAVFAFEKVTVVGVKRNKSLQFGSARPKVYVPLLQANQTRTLSSSLKLSFKTQNIEEAIAELYRHLAKFDAPLQITDISDQLAIDKQGKSAVMFATVCLATVSLFTLMMALIGIYGMAQSQVNQSQYEIGLRRALGSTDNKVIGLMLKKNASYVGWGLGCATVLFVACVTIFYLFAKDIPLSIYIQSGVAAFVGLTTVVGLALYLPVKEVVKQQPSTSLRMD
ncbi:hypothetical protein CS022_22140 [Veronia nyctiphanis]|uniref:Permease n=1 Tax=Veronia nyctiphanis TaxID=1278244 RepID=A0A4Q0YJE3_9GAMM|nr:ABC transporter permease [Veronia nyctiphanis]RXJ70832.1 hypothetical protein CS022_22140 [Veronia nyctiphanis]